VTVAAIPFLTPLAAAPLARWKVSPALVAGLLALTVARLAFAAVIPLTEDEAYYRLWAEHLSFGYFDHPPMVAWWIAAGRALVGDNPLGARVTAIFATLLVSVLIIDLGRQLGLSDQTAQRAALWYNATLTVALGGAVTTPDAPATLFWTICLWALARSWRTGRNAWWIAAGAAAGLATLSKYSALFIGPGVLLWLAASPKGRRTVLTPWPWLALVVGAALFAPNLIWNAQHHWLSFAKQFSRLAPSAFTPRHVIDFPATQFFLVNPFVAIFAIRGFARTPWTQSVNAGLRLLPLGLAPFAGYLVLHSFHAAVQAHWTAPLYPTIALLAARGAEDASGRIPRALARVAPWFGFGAALIVLIHMAAPQTDWFGRHDPVIALRGWPTLAETVETVRLREHAGWIGTLSYGTAAQLRDQRKSPAPVVELIERARYGFEGAIAPPKGSGVVVELSRRIEDDDLTACFGQVRRLEVLSRGDPGRPGLPYTAYLVGDPKVDLIVKGCREGKDRDRGEGRRR